MILTLPSDGSNRGGDTPTDFTTSLPQGLYLKENSLVGLRDFHLPLRWNNVVDGNRSFWFVRAPIPADLKGEGLSVLYENGEPSLLASKSPPTAFALHRATVPAGQYDRPSDLVAALNKAATEAGTGISFYFKEATFRTYIIVSQFTALVFPDKATGLGWLLGFKSQCYLAGSYRADYEVFQHKIVTAVNVECDLIEPQLVGGSLAPVLRTVPVLSEKRDETIVRRYDRPEYYRINKSQVDSVRVRICDADSGRPIRLEGGKTIVTLQIVDSEFY